MSVRTQVAEGAPIWIDLSTSDQPKSVAFYSALFGWDAEAPAPEFGGYLNFSVAGEPVAGCVPAMPGAPTDLWTVYLAASDAEQTAKAAVAAGGTVPVPPMPVHELGTMAMVAHPGAAPVGVWQPGTHRGLLTLDEPGRPGWFELGTRDYDATLTFLRATFGWQTEPVAEGPDRYSVASVNGEQVAGIADTPDAEEARWSVYFRVEDADVALARAEELGGKVVQAPQDTPYGRFAIALDPTGVSFKLVA